ncbi:MAG: lipid-A-disaccharide synthase [Chitinophagales bacterium]|jgi:lipid-A-disaccharide synthase
MKIGIVAGETSGDYLGSELIKAFKVRYPDAEFVGLAGPLMKQQGAVSLAEMDKISIMGIAGALKGVFEIFSIRKKIQDYMFQWRPDVFIGIDVPDFNLRLEINLKQAGIPTVHYVSPTVWAWRGKRITKIKRAIDLMLTLFPFEEVFYQQRNTPVKYVGHPLAKQVLSWHVSDDARKAINLSAGKRLIALLPGSRMSEVSRLAPVMLEACSELAKRYPDLEFIIPAASEKLYRYLVDELNSEVTPVGVIQGYSRDVLALSHLAVLASGTAALEAALFAKPMVVMYKVSKLEEWYAARTMEVEHFSMPNHLTNPPIVTELIQDNATAANMVSEVSKLLDHENIYQSMQEVLAELAPRLSEESGELACDAIDALLKAKAEGSE